MTISLQVLKLPFIIIGKTYNVLNFYKYRLCWHLNFYLKFC